MGQNTPPSAENQNFSSTAWCNPTGEKSCCQTGVCVEKTICDKMSGPAWNSIPSQSGSDVSTVWTYIDVPTEKQKERPYRQEMSLYKEGEACLYKPKTSDFRLFNKKELIKKLQGKQLSIIGDSNARNMFTTLVSWIQDDYMFNENLYTAITKNAWEKCKGYYHLFFSKYCFFQIEQAYNFYQGDNFVIKYKNFIGTRNWKEYTDEEFLSEDLESHYILSIGMHNHYNPDMAMKWIERVDGNAKKLDRKVNAAFITPPSLSFAHDLKYKDGQSQQRLTAMNEKVHEWIKNNSSGTRFIDFTRLSRNLISCDGIHYGFNLNKILLSIYFAGL